MAQNRRDLYGECNVDGTPIDVFAAECCVRCVNPECTRSSRGGKFELRVATWEDRLFENPPRMSEGDERFARIAHQKFETTDAGPLEVRSSSGWDAAPAENKGARFAALVAKAEPLQPPTDEPAPKPQPIPKRMVLTNAPTQTGKTVGQPPPPPRDPWAASASSGSSGPIISPGATVKFGRGGV